jgi:hypothetical protein
MGAKWIAEGIWLFEIAIAQRVFIMSMIAFRRGLITGVSVASFLAVSTSVPTASAGTPTLLTELQFNSSALSAPGWVFGSNNGASISISSTPSPVPTAGNVYAMEGSYPVPTGAQYIWANYSIARLQTEDIYIEFWAKMPGVKEGCKFLKVFGQRLTSTSYANMTIYTDYTGADYGAIRQVEYGDGTSITNDAQDAIYLSGVNPSMIGRSYGTASVLTPQMRAFASTDWGMSWHHFRTHIKFNSGTTMQNQVPDGAVYLEIDGKVYVDATGLYNRNPANGPIDYIEFFGWAQTESQPFQLWYDDVRISTGGFITKDATPQRRT